MSILEHKCLIKACLMEGYSHYLINYKRIPSKAKIYVNLVRKFHNYVGKPYIDIEQQDILKYLFYLGEKEKLTERSIYRHFTAIKRFYEYLWFRGDIAELPSDGVIIKNLEKLQSIQR